MRAFLFTTVRQVLSVGWIAGLLQMPTLHAQVDQENWVIGEPRADSINPDFDLRQEFTPTLSALDSIQLSVAQNGMQVMSLVRSSIQIDLREGGADGPIIASSLAVEFPPYFAGNAVFRFAEPIILTPGQVYAFQPLSLQANTAPPPFDATMAQFSPDYPGGRLFFGGSIYAGDLIFREGISVPEPPPGLLLTIAAGVLGMAAAACSRRDHLRSESAPLPSGSRGAPSLEHEKA